MSHVGHLAVCLSCLLILSAATLRGADGLLIGLDRGSSRRAGSDQKYKPELQRDIRQRMAKSEKEQRNSGEVSYPEQDNPYRRPLVDDSNVLRLIQSQMKRDSSAAQAKPPFIPGKRDQVSDDEVMAFRRTLIYVADALRHQAAAAAAAADSSEYGVRMKPLARFLLVFLHYTQRLIIFTTWPVFHWLYNRARRGVPPVRSDLLMKSGIELSAMIRQHQVTCLEVVDTVIARIKEVNPMVNAVVADRFEDARKDAANVDRILSSGSVPEELSEQNAPYLGVPFTAKEAVSVAGLPNTSGMLVRRDVISSQDADAVARMRKAGAIPVAVTNLSELCMWYEASNYIYGRTNNPYHHGRTAGGSSGGEACSLSAAASVVGIASDIGGSIRMPAFFNGVFGHKATTDVVSNIGQYPMGKGDAYSFLSTGPLCRYAADLLPMFKLLVLDDQRAKLRLDEEVDVRQLKFYYMEDDGGGYLISSVHHDVKAAVTKAAKHFESVGCTVKRVSFHQLRKSFAIWSSLMRTSGNDTFCSLLANGPPNLSINPFYELLLWLVGCGRHTLPAISLGIGEKIHSTPQEEAQLRRLRDALRDDMEECLAEDGVFLYPTLPLPAPFHNQPVLLMFDFAYTAIFNVMGLPATAVPMGLAPDEGVPVGIQAIAGRYQDRLTLAVALALEEAFGGWVPPFPLSK